MARTAPDVLERVAAVNVGLAGFGDAVREQGAQAVDVDWRPPAGGDTELVLVLEGLWGRHGERVAAANGEVVARLEAASPRAIAVVAGRDAIEALRRPRTLLHSGPSI